VFGNQRFPLTRETTFKSRREKKYYNLCAVWYLLKYEGLPLQEYESECKKHNVVPISTLADRLEILNWIKGTGKSDSNTQLEGVPEDTPSAKRKRRETDMDVSTANGVEMTENDSTVELKNNNLTSSSGRTSFPPM